MTAASRSHPRTPLAIGWEAARANLVPALFVQAAMLALLVAYDSTSFVRRQLQLLAEYKAEHGLTFVVIAAILAGAVLPELFLILFFQRGRPTVRSLRNLLFTIPIWGIDGSLVDWLYRSEATWFADVVTLPVVLAKICV